MIDVICNARKKYEKSDDLGVKEPDRPFRNKVRPKVLRVLIIYSVARVGVGRNLTSSQTSIPTRERDTVETAYPQYFLAHAE